MLRSLSDIQAFVSVANTLSFTKASAEMHVTPTAISKAVARLEKELDTQLFYRTTRQVQLTEEGALFLARCVAAFVEIEAGLDALDVMRDEATGPVRISAPYILGRPLATSLPDLTTRHPSLNLRIDLTDTYVDLAEDRVDVAIRVGSTAPAANHEIPLATLNWVTVASPIYLQKTGVPDSPHTLSQHQCHHFVTPAGDLAPWVFADDAGETKLTPRGGVKVNQGELLVDIALADGGIVQVFDFMVKDALRDGRLVRLFADQEADGPNVQAVVLRSRAETPRIKAVLQHLQQLFGRL